MSYGGNGRTALDDTLEMCAYSHATPVFTHGLITEEEAASAVPGIRLRGHTAMRNEGVRMALKGGYDYLFLLENDARCPLDTIDRLITHNVDIVVPHLTYPDMPIVEMICFGPQPTSQQKGLHELGWAAHTAILFNCKALKRFRTRRRVFMGYPGEGQDHEHWHKLGLKTWMDLATPIEVMELARGHIDMLKIPFRVHLRGGQSCEGPVYEWKRSQYVSIYRCRVEECDYELIFQPPPMRPNDQDVLTHPSVRAHLAIERDSWAERAPNYRNLWWAAALGYQEAVVEAGTPTKDDVVLDAGTGPGYIVNAVAPQVARVVGMDLSPHMMKGTKGGGNQEFVEGDIRAIPYPKGYYSKVYARMVFHCLVEKGDLQKAARECYRVLQEGGRFVMSEGIASTASMDKWWRQMMALKEERVPFNIPRMKRLLASAGFKNIEVATHIIKQTSTKNWLENSGLSPENMERVMRFNRHMPEHVRRAYNARLTSDDVIVDVKFAIVTGEK